MPEVNTQVSPRPTMRKNITNAYEMRVRKKMYFSGEDSDVRFVVGEGNRQKVFRLHRFMLNMGSRKLRSILEENKGKEVIALPDMSPALFDALMRVIYMHKLDFTNIASLPTYEKVFEEYGLYATAQQCLEQITGAISVYEATEKTRQNSDILDECLGIFRAHTKNILSSDTFLRAKPETVVDIFALPELSIDSELDLLRALEEYAVQNNALPEHNPGGNQKRFIEMVQPALCHIRFCILTPSDVMCPAAKSLLSQDEILGILSMLLDPENRMFSYPDRFSKKTEARWMMFASTQIDASTIEMSNNQTVPRETTIMWSVTDLAKCIYPTPPQSEDIPLGNSTVDSVILVSKETETATANESKMGTCKDDSSWIETCPTINASNNSYQMKKGAPLKGFLSKKKESPAANSFYQNGNAQKGILSKKKESPAANSFYQNGNAQKGADVSELWE